MVVAVISVEWRLYGNGQYPQCVHTQNARITQIGLRTNAGQTSELREGQTKSRKLMTDYKDLREPSQAELSLTIIKSAQDDQWAVGLIHHRLCDHSVHERLKNFIIE